MWSLHVAGSPQEINQRAKTLRIHVTNPGQPAHNADLIDPLYVPLANSLDANAGAWRIPPSVGAIFVNKEDSRFFWHPGVDPIALVRAIFRSDGGASTITQQLARILFLSTDRSYIRKLREVVLAVYLDAILTKDQILEFYLNQVYFGHDYHGIEAASRGYFETEVHKLTDCQAHALAHTLPAPAVRNPRNYSLFSCEVAPRGTLTVHWPPQSRFFARDYGYEQAKETLGREFRGELLIELSVEAELQLYVERAANRALQKASELGFEQIAIVVMGYDGAILALTGSASYSLSPWNRAVSAERQAGSSFKVFVYAAALLSGFEPSTEVQDRSTDFDGYRPGNMDRKFLGTMEMRRAFAISRNLPAVRVTREVGVEAVREVAQRLGVNKANQPDDLTLALGSGTVTLLDLVAAYGTIANGGQPLDPWIVRTVHRPTGAVVFRRDRPEAEPVYPRDKACELTAMLRLAVVNGTGRGAAIRGVAVAGKTGTTQDGRDAWFVGFTNQLVAGVWVGVDDNSPTNGVTGGGLPAEVIGGLMATAHEGLDIRKRAACDVPL